MKPSSALKGEADLAARKGDWKYESGATAASSATTPAETASASEAPATGTTSLSAADVEAAEEAKPASLYSDAPSDADDLKQIKGVGPGLEKTLNELGIYKFDQITTWAHRRLHGWMRD